MDKKAYNRKKNSFICQKPTAAPADENTLATLIFYLDNDNDDIYVEALEPIVMAIKLTAKEINVYVNVRKELSKYFYYSFLTDEISNLSEGAKVWIDKLNRIGISYFSLCLQ